jgi:Amt family ammonium transporter
MSLKRVGELIMVLPTARKLAACLFLAVSGSTAHAQEAVARDSGDAAWIITATTLVLFMTIPALALFYGGLVRARNVLSVFMHCIAITCLASLLWVIAGYSLAFSDGGSLNAWVGGTDKFLLSGIGIDSLSGKIPEYVFVMFQMTFAIITPALIVGAYAERVKFAAVLLFSALWLMLVYVPVAHWIWGGGWLAKRGVMDFAGGIVVHTTAGVSALLFAIMLGRRKGFLKDISPPHQPGYVYIGAAMLWVGWFGFNAGSALAANGNAGLAMLNTHLSAAAASLGWMTIEWLRFKKPSLIGLVTGTIAGLATVTPGAGYISPGASILFGLLGAAICFTAVQLVKQKWKIDDSLDVFAVHGIGGMLGSVLTAVFAASSLGGLGLAADVSIGQQLGTQILGTVVVALWSLAVSWLILQLCKATFGLRVDMESEHDGLDLSSHGERAYEN